jgi:hypothetical protein
MVSRAFCVISIAVLLSSAGLAAPPTDPQAHPSSKRHVVKPPRPGDPRARVTVEKRSFLDAGTEVLPGQRKFLDYAYPPGYSPSGVIDYTSGNVVGPRGGLLNPWGFSAPLGW